MAKIRPLDDRIVIKVLDAEEVSSGGILLPDSAKEKPQRGKVTAVGNGRLTKDGKRIKPDVKKGDVVLFGKYLGSGKRGSLEVKNGDIVLYGKYAGSDVNVDGQDYKILRESEILAKVGG